MTRIIIIIIAITASVNICAQNVAINNNTALPDPSARVDISNTSKGLLVYDSVKAVQEQQQQIEALKKENAQIKAQLQKLVEFASKK